MSSERIRLTSARPFRDARLDHFPPILDERAGLMQRCLTIALAILAGLGAVGVDDDEEAMPERVEAPGIENLYRLSPRLLSGGQPEGGEAFRALADLGVRTIVTVDGAVPDLESAARYGIRYVHLPVGYDGIPEGRAAALVKAARTLPGPIYVHCHHGKHRGPAAAAICAIAIEGWDRESARAWLELAGTSPDYAGLFASVAAFEPPTAEELASLPESALTERAEVPDLVEAMVDVDSRWEHLKAVVDAGFRPPPEHPDLDPPHEALMLAEHYRELRRLDESEGRGEAFLDRLGAAERNALSLRDALRPPPDGEPIDREAASAAFKAAGADCKACHVTFRDRLP
jgi:protein tyrosine phosphatase (PTP) superfamily phosphohydrolase (DUF442 family)